MDKERNREGRRVGASAERIRENVLKGTLYAVFGYFSGLAVLPFGAMPFGIALLAAADRRAPFVYVGLALSCFLGYGQEQGLMLLGVYTALVLLRILVRLTLDPVDRDRKRRLGELAASFFGERVTYRVLSAAVGGFGLGLCFFAGGGMLYYDLAGVIIATAVAPAAAYAFYGYFSRSDLSFEIGFLAIALVCTYGASELSILGASASAFFAFTVALYITDRRGILRGSVCGLALGLVYSPVLSPAFAIGALSVGLLGRISATLGTVGAFFGAVAWGFYVKGIYALDGFFAAVLSACAVYGAISRYTAVGREAKESAKRGAGCRCLSRSELDGVRLYDMNMRMSAVSEGLDELSSFLEGRRENMLETSELEEICLAAFDASCASCSQRGECMGADRELGRAEIGRLARRLLRGERISSQDISEDIRDRCMRLPDILDEINYNSGYSDAWESDRGDSYNYRVVSRLLEQSVARQSREADEYEIDRDASEKLKEELERNGFCELAVAVYGSDRRRVYVSTEHSEGGFENKRGVIECVERALGFAVDRERARVRKCSEGSALMLTERDRLCVEGVTRQIKAEGEAQFCGDSVALLRSEAGCYYAMLSDGMGSGREASAVSKTCIGFLSNMLSASELSRELLEVLNEALRVGRARECSATLDLMALDLISGRARFYKSGAAPTYVYRESDGSFFKLRSRTMPIGILKEIDLRELELNLKKGDVVVMISDGVTGNSEECPWLFELLRQNIGNGELERTAELIVKYAVAHGSEDDVSVSVLKIASAA